MNLASSGTELRSNDLKPFIMTPQKDSIKHFHATSNLFLQTPKTQYDSNIQTPNMQS